MITTSVKKKPVTEPIKKPAPVVKREQPVVKREQPENEYVDPRLVASAAEYLGLNIQGAV